MLKYSGVKRHVVSNLLPNGSAKAKKGRDQATGKWQQLVNGGGGSPCSFDWFFTFPVGLKN